MEQNQDFSLKETSDITGLSNDLLRLYEKEFNLQVARTKGGHRRYTKQNIELLLSIKQKIQDQRWSYKQVSAWINGNVEPLIENQEVVSTIEKQMDAMQKEMAELRAEIGALTQINRELVISLQKQSEYIMGLEEVVKPLQLMAPMLEKSLERKKWWEFWKK